MLRESKKTIIDTCKKWTKSFIIDLNLCPFAKGPFEQGRIHYVVYGEPSLEKLLRSFGDEVERLKRKSTKELETTLVIVPALGRMEHFHMYFNFCQEMLEINEEANNYSLIPFHPLMRHKEHALNAPNHFTGIVPYPIVHILREASVDKAGRAYKGADIQWQNNITLQGIGTKKLDKMWQKMLED